VPRVRDGGHLVAVQQSGWLFLRTFRAIRSADGEATPGTSALFCLQVQQPLLLREPPDPLHLPRDLGSCFPFVSTSHARYAQIHTCCLT